VTVPTKVCELLERFDSNREAYLSNYNETQVRGDFIAPFLEELGWDVHIRQGHPEVYRRVIEEDKLKMGGGTRAPDYGFCMGGARKFFLEAKKPSVDIAGEVAPAVQLRR
jgi:predicted type IV restriction endonuclease